MGVCFVWGLREIEGGGGGGGAWDVEDLLNGTMCVNKCIGADTGVDKTVGSGILWM